MANKIQLRRDTAANWLRVNPTLADGEPGLDLDSNRIKYGDGTTPWQNLPYASADRLTKGSHQLVLDDNGTLVVSAPNFMIDFGPGTDPYWVAEYGGLGANTANAYVYGAGAVYDSKGNVYVLGTAQGNLSGIDSLLLKYDPQGNLLWHKTWHDPTGSNCGSTNVAVAIDKNDRLYWAANDWSGGGCWTGYMDTDGNLMLNSVSQQVLGFSQFNPSDLACDNLGNYYIAGTWNNSGGGTHTPGIPLVVKVNGNTGAVAWTSDITPLDSSGDSTTGTFRAVTVDPNTGDVWAIGDYVDSASKWSMLSKWNSTGSMQWTNKLVTSTNDAGEAVVYNNGHVYTVVNDSAESKTVVSKFDPDGALLWAASLAVGISPAPQGYDLSFDSANNVYLTGILSNNLWVTKLNPNTGAMIYVRTLATLASETVNDGQNDPIVGHRVGDIYQDKIAITAMTQGDLTQPGNNFESRIIIAQLPLDGSITGNFNNITITDATSMLYSNCTVGTYTLTPLIWPTDNVGTNISTRSQMSASTATVIDMMSNQIIGIGAGSRSNNWNFGADGTLVFPDLTVQTTAWTGLASGGGTGSFGTDLGIGPNYRANNPAILFSDDDMLIRTGGTSLASGEGYGELDIVAGESIYVGVPPTQGLGLVDLTGHPTYGAYLYASTNYGSGTEIQLVAGTNTLAVNSSSGLTYNGSPVSANTAETAFDANGIYNNANHNITLAAFWDSGPGYSYVTVPSDGNSATVALQLVNAKESGGGVNIITSNNNNGNTQHVWDFTSTGNLTVPGSIIMPIGSGITGASDNVEIIANTAVWTFGNNGNLIIPAGGNITSTAGYVGTAIAVSNVNVAVGSNVVTVTTTTDHGLGEGDKITITGIASNSTHELNNGLYYVHVDNTAHVDLYTDSKLTIPVDGSSVSPYFNYVNRTMSPVNSPAFSQLGPFNNSALQFDGSSNFVQIHDNTSALALSEFTWETWINITSSSLGAVWHQSFYNNSLAFVIYFYHEQMWFVIGDGPNMYLDTSVIAPIMGNWGHLAISRDISNNVTFYVNGVQANINHFVPGTGYVSDTSVTCANQLASDWVTLGFGLQNPQSGGHYFNGQLSGVRMSNIGRYTGNFTPGSSTIAADANTVLLMSVSPYAPLQDSSSSDLLIDTSIVISVPFNGTDGDFAWTTNIPGNAAAWTQGIFLLQAWGQGNPIPTGVDWYVSIGTTTTGTVTGTDSYSSIDFLDVSADPGPYSAIHITFTTANAFHAGDVLTLTTSNAAVAPAVVASSPAALAITGSIDTTAGYLATAAGSDLTINGDFTFECWFYANSFSTSAIDYIFSTGAAADSLTSADNGMQIGFLSYNGVGGASIMYSQVYHGGQTVSTQLLSSPLITNTWHHLAVSNQNQVVTFWIDGVQVWSRSNPLSYVVESSGSPAAIGFGPNGSSHTFQGLVADIRFVINNGLYSSSQSTISVPVSPYSVVGGTKLLMVTNNSGNYTLDSSESVPVGGGGNVLAEFRSADLTIEVGAVTTEDPGSIHLVSGTNTWTFSGDGELALPGGSAVIRNDGEFKIWATDTNITVYRNGQDGYSVKSGEIDVYAGNAKITKTTTGGLELLQGNVTLPAGGVVKNNDNTTYAPASLPICIINSSNTTSLPNNQIRVNFTVDNPSGSTITAIGIFVPGYTSQYGLQAADSNTVGTQDKILINMDNLQRYAQVYATNSNGTAYSPPFLLVGAGICLLAGTMISLADGSYKAIEDITYTDRMISWDFDLGCYAETKAVWIKRSETGSQYNLLTFSDGTTLRTFDQHRIFNKQAGAFTYPMTDATPIGTITVNEHGQELTLVDKQVVVDTIEYYNVITDYHMNLFSDSILTSCRFNNIYPIIDMKFVKDTRILRTRDEFINIPDRYFYGLRLAEQTTDIETVEWYVNRLVNFEVESQLVTV